MKGPGKLLFLVTEDWYFCSHRFELAREAKKSGYDVVVATQVNSHGKKIKNEGFKLIPVTFPRSFRRPWRDISTLLLLYNIYRREQPDLIHHVSLKPVIYGSLIIQLLSTFRKPINKPVIINALTGLGYSFSSHKLSARLIRVILVPVMRFLFSRYYSRVIFQNQDDKQLFISKNIVREKQACLIRGSGVDIETFSECEENDSPIRVMLVARMLYDKGIEEFVEAAKILKNKAVKAEFVLVGDIDKENPSAIRRSTIDDWQSEGLIEWWGKCSDMNDVYRKSHIVCLPSYREGLPKVLVEAAATGRAIVATDVPGCREIVIDGNNGLLVPPRDSRRLAEAIDYLIHNPEIRKKMGREGRKRVEQNFSNAIIIKQTLDLYNNSLEISHGAPE